MSSFITLFSTFFTLLPHLCTHLLSPQHRVASRQSATFSFLHLAQYSSIFLLLYYAIVSITDNLTPCFTNFIYCLIHVPEHLDNALNRINYQHLNFPPVCFSHYLLLLKETLLLTYHLPALQPINVPNFHAICTQLSSSLSCKDSAFLTK